MYKKSLNYFFLIEFIIYRYATNNEIKGNHLLLWKQHY